MFTNNKNNIKLREKIHNYLLFLTNNEKKPSAEWRKDEINFDIGFFIAGLISVIIAFIMCIMAAFIYLKGNEKLAWITIFLVWSIETSILTFLPFWDEIRHNRED